MTRSRRLALALAAALAAILLIVWTIAPSLAPAARMGVLYTPAPSPAPSASPTRSPAASPAPSPTPPSPTPSPSPELLVRAEASGGTLTFRLSGRAPAGAREALLWLDTAAGREPRRIAIVPGAPLSATVALSATQVITAGEVGPAASLDYWAAIAGDAPLRRFGELALPPEIAEIGQAAAVTPTLSVTWTERLTPHFRLYAPPGSPAARDLDQLAKVAEDGYAQAAAVISPTAPISVPVYLLPRVFWQGGVAYGRGGPLIISYLDRNYAGVEIWSYFVHEVTHAIGAELLPEGAEVGGLLGEGIAVLATGGHYAREPIDARAATIAASDSYIPLCRLRFDFYAAQHETAYTQAASFTQHMIRVYGKDAFLELYRAQRPQRGSDKQTAEQFCAEDGARLSEPLGKTNAELEREWLAYLAGLAPTDAQAQAWQLTVRQYETMRRYQEALDPPARVLPPPPSDWDNDDAALALIPAGGRRAAAYETMLVASSAAIRAGELDRAAALLDSLDATIAAGGAPAGELAAAHDAIAGLVEVQARALRLGDAAALAATLADPALAARLPFGADDLLRDLRLTMLRLDVRGDAAEAVVAVRGDSLDGRTVDGERFSARYVKTETGWLLSAWD